MPRRVRLTVVAEDRQQEMFLRRVLYEHGFTVHDLRIETCPKASHAADAWVLRTHADEVKKLRSRQHAQPGIGLITAIDADDYSVQERHRQLDAVAGHESSARAPGERIAYVVPRRNIETWLRVLAGQPGDEETDYKKRGQSPVDCSKEASAFVLVCRQNAGMSASIRAACPEFQRVCP